MSDKPADMYAFARPFSEDKFNGIPYQPQHGMSIRDYFATAAMQAMVTKSSGQDSTDGMRGVPLLAKYAYEYADAMIKERART